MNVKFCENNKQIKQKSLKLLPMRGDLISFDKKDYYVVESIEHHYELNCIIIRIVKI